MRVKTKSEFKCLTKSWCTRQRGQSPKSGDKKDNMRTLNVLFAAFGNMIGSVTVPDFLLLKIRWDDKQHRNDYC